MSQVTLTLGSTLVKILTSTELNTFYVFPCFDVSSETRNRQDIIKFNIGFYLILFYYFNYLS